MLLLKISKESLLAPLQSVSGIVERKHTLPILSNVLLSRQADKLTFVATDIEIEITTSTDVSGQEGNDISLTVGARKLLDILRALPDGQQVTLEVGEKRMQIKAGKSRFNLQTLPDSDFPRMVGSTERRSEIIIKQGDLRHLLAKTQYAMAVQDVRYYLNGLLLVASPEALIAVATDGHRMAYCHKEMNCGDERIETILPRKTILELSRLLTNNDENVKISFFDSQISFDFSGILLVSKVIDGKFPDYERVIPSPMENDIELERTQLLQSLNRVAVLTNEKFRGIRVVLVDNVMKISYLNADQEEAEEEIDINYGGEQLDIGFNITYLHDVLNNLAEDKVIWSFGDSNNSGTIFSVPSNTSFKYVVMPMRI